MLKLHPSQHQVKSWMKSLTDYLVDMGWMNPKGVMPQNHWTRVYTCLANILETEDHRKLLNEIGNDSTK
jgi:hypothetical protein